MILILPVLLVLGNAAFTWWNYAVADYPLLALFHAFACGFATAWLLVRVILYSERPRIPESLAERFYRD